MADNPRIEELRRRVQKDPASIAFAQLAEECRRAGEHEEAVRVCRAGLGKHPSYLSARVTLGRALIELERYDEAHAELQHVLRAAPENLAAIRGLAEIHQRRGELGEALKQYQTALGIARHDPDLEESVHELARQLGPEHAPAPPPIPVAVSAPPAAPPSLGPSVPELPEPSAQPLEALEPPLPVAAPALSPGLEAAADEFTRALHALDAISIDVPAPELPADAFHLPDLPLATTGTEPSVPMPEPPPSAVESADAIPDAPLAGHPADVLRAAPEPAAPPSTSTHSDAQALHELENWLGNITLDRGATKQP